MVTGTRLDVARCIVVGLSLSSNNLSGVVTPAALQLPRLALLRLGNNSLRGQIPAELLMGLSSDLSRPSSELSRRTSLAT